VGTTETVQEVFASRSSSSVTLAITGTGTGGSAIDSAVSVVVLGRQ
jgi:hypothetical protein